MGNDRDIGRRIRERREELHIKRPAFAKMCGMPYSTLADIENGRQKKTTELDVIATKLKTTPAALRGDQTHDDPHISEGALTIQEMNFLHQLRMLTSESLIKLEGYMDGLQKKKLGKIAVPVTVPRPAIELGRSKRSG